MTIVSIDNQLLAKAHRIGGQPVVAQHDARRRRDAVRLLARNDAPVWPCTECDEPAVSLCSYCTYEGDAFFCEAHVEDHKCGDEAMLPVVNSPRMGVCAYTGDDSSQWLQGTGVTLI